MILDDEWLSLAVESFPVSERRAVASRTVGLEVCGGSGSLRTIQHWASGCLIDWWAVEEFPVECSLLVRLPHSALVRSFSSSAGLIAEWQHIELAAGVRGAWEVPFPLVQRGGIDSGCRGTDLRVSFECGLPGASTWLFDLSANDGVLAGFSPLSAQGSSTVDGLRVVGSGSALVQYASGMLPFNCLWPTPALNGDIWLVAALAGVLCSSAVQEYVGPRKSVLSSFATYLIELEQIQVVEWGRRLGLELE